MILILIVISIIRYFYFLTSKYRDNYEYNLCFSSLKDVTRIILQVIFDFERSLKFLNLITTNSNLICIVFLKCL